MRDDYHWRLALRFGWGYTSLQLRKLHKSLKK